MEAVKAQFLKENTLRVLQTERNFLMIPYVIKVSKFIMNEKLQV